MLAQSLATDDFDLAEEQRLASLELAAPRLDGYDVLELIGEGTYGDVWKARDISSGVIVAIKRLRRQPDAQSCAEVEKLAHLSNVRGIVALRDVHLATEPYCYVMEHLDGGTLADLIRRERQLPFADAWRIFRQLNEALAYVHGEGIIHCDIKPENILLDARGNPRLGDFGQARGRGPGGAALGTRFYMSPEQARLEGLPDPRWDVYALGAVLYEMLTGVKSRFDIEVASLMSSPTGSGSEVRDRLEKYARHLERCPALELHHKTKGVDSATTRLIDDCLSIEFSDRPQDAADVLKRIAQCEHARASKPLLVFGGIAPAILLLAAAITIFAAGWFFLRSLEGDWTKLVQKSNPSVAKDIAAQVKSLYEEQMSEVVSKAKDPALVAALESHPGLPPGDDHYVKALKPIVGDAQRFLRWSITDRTGQQVSLYGCLRRGDKPDQITENYGKNFAWREWFNGVADHPAQPQEPDQADLDAFRRRTPDVALVTPPFMRVSGKEKDRVKVISVSCPIVGSDGHTPIGVLSASINYDDFFDRIKSRVSDLAKGRQRIVIVDEKSQVIFHSQRDAWERAGQRANQGQFKPPLVKDAAYVRDALEQNPAEQPDGVSFIDPIDGQVYAGAAHVIALPGERRLAVFAQQENPIPFYRTLALVLASGLVVTGIVFLATNSYALYWTLRQQGASASEAGESLARGRGESAALRSPSASGGPGRG